jgi:cobalt/nickel transport protein
MKPTFVTLAAGLFILSNASLSTAHFGMLIPKEPMVSPDNRTIHLTLSFSHPFEERGMDLSKPAALYVIKDQQKTDLLPSLTETRIMDHRGWETNYSVKRPGVYQFVMEPTPYWEPSEDLSIIHYTKVIIPAFGSEDGWDSAVGLPIEIVPRMRPFGNYAGNSFTGQVLVHGKPLPDAEVEVELYNRGQKFTAPSDLHITQVIKADAAGIFTFTCPQPGWWGFAALSSADYTIKNPEGEEKGVELGAVLWTYMDAYLPTAKATGAQ